MGMRADNHALDALRYAVDSLHCTYVIAYLRGQPDSGCLTQVLYRQLSRPFSSCEGLLRQTTGLLPVLSTSPSSPKFAVLCATCTTTQCLSQLPGLL